MATRGLTSSVRRAPVSSSGGIPEDKYIAQAEELYRPIQEKRMERLGQERAAEQEIARSEGDIQTAKFQQEKSRLERTQAEEEKYAGDVRNLYQQAETKLEKYPFPTYKPTQEDATSYAQLGSMVITLGMMIGGGAKASGKSALASMTGMINGWREGRQDLWRREAQQFDKDLQRIKSERDAIQQSLEKGLKLAATDRKAAQASIDTAAHIAGEGVLKEMIKKGQLIPALNHLKQANVLITKIEDDRLNRAATQENIARQEKQQEANRRAQIEAAQTKAAAKTGTQSGIGKVAEGKIEAKASLLKQYDALIEDYEKNKDKYQLPPGTRTLLAAMPGGASVSEKLMKIARTNPTKYPNAAALSEFIGKLESVIAPDRHSLYGANLTANELPRYERTIPTVTDDPEIFRKFLENNRNTVENSLRNSQDFYSRRGVNLKLSEIYDKAKPFSATATGVPTFNTLKEAEAANLEPGTKIMVGGRSATVQ